MYVVPMMNLIPQPLNMGCWYASAQMLIQWKRRTASATFRDNPDPSEVPGVAQWEVNNAGITNPQVVSLAQQLGLKQVPPQSPTLQFLEDLMKRYGPLWTNGKSHIIVLAGIDQAKSTILVYDPWPPKVGKVEWRPFSTYVTGGNAARDTGKDVQAVFLYHP
jgi:hypothetical protein